MSVGVDVGVGGGECGFECGGECRCGCGCGCDSFEVWCCGKGSIVVVCGVRCAVAMCCAEHHFQCLLLHIHSVKQVMHINKKLIF